MLYTTIQGDTFDSIAFKLFKDRKYTKELIEANAKFLTTVIFSAGVVLNVPEINQEYANTFLLPPWRR